MKCAATGVYYNGSSFDDIFRLLLSRSAHDMARFYVAWSTSDATLRLRCAVQHIYGGLFQESQGRQSGEPNSQNRDIRPDVFTLQCTPIFSSPASYQDLRTWKIWIALQAYLVAVFACQFRFVSVACFGLFNAGRHSVTLCFSSVDTKPHALCH